MDTIIILLSLATLILLWKKPRSNAGFALFWVAWLATVLLFKFHVTAELPLSF